MTNNINLNLLQNGGYNFSRFDIGNHWISSAGKGDGIISVDEMGRTNVNKNLTNALSTNFDTVQNGVFNPNVTLNNNNLQKIVADFLGVRNPDEAQIKQGLKEIAILQALSRGEQLEIKDAQGRVTERFNTNGTYEMTNELSENGTPLARTTFRPDGTKIVYSLDRNTDVETTKVYDNSTPPRETSVEVKDGASTQTTNYVYNGNKKTTTTTSDDSNIRTVQVTENEESYTETFDGDKLTSVVDGRQTPAHTYTINHYLHGQISITKTANGKQEIFVVPAGTSLANFDEVKRAATTAARTSEITDTNSDSNFNDADTRITFQSVEEYRADSQSEVVPANTKNVRTTFPPNASDAGVVEFFGADGKLLKTINYKPDITSTDEGPSTATLKNADGQDIKTIFLNSGNVGEADVVTSAGPPKQVLIRNNNGVNRETNYLERLTYGRTGEAVRERTSFHYSGAGKRLEITTSGDDMSYTRPGTIVQRDITNGQALETRTVNSYVAGVNKPSGITIRNGENGPRTEELQGLQYGNDGNLTQGTIKLYGSNDQVATEITLNPPATEGGKRTAVIKKFDGHKYVALTVELPDDMQITVKNGRLADATGNEIRLSVADFDKFTPIRTETHGSFQLTPMAVTGGSVQELPEVAHRTKIEETIDGVETTTLRGGNPERTLEKSFVYGDDAGIASKTLRYDSSGKVVSALIVDKEGNKYYCDLTEEDLRDLLIGEGGYDYTRNFSRKEPAVAGGEAVIRTHFQDGSYKEGDKYYDKDGNEITRPE
jgi:hypothetical protein